MASATQQPACSKHSHSEVSLSRAALSFRMLIHLLTIADPILVETICPAMLEISLTKSMSLFATVSLYPAHRCVLLATDVPRIRDCPVVVLL